MRQRDFEKNLSALWHVLGRGADGRTESSPLRSDTPCDQEVRKEAQYLATGRRGCARSGQDVVFVSEDPTVLDIENWRGGVEGKESLTSRSSRQVSHYSEP